MRDIELQRKLVPLSKQPYQFILIAHRFITIKKEGRRSRERDYTKRVGETELLSSKLLLFGLPYSLTEKRRGRYDDHRAPQEEERSRSVE